ncbi:hypothetical protein GOBAR_DD27383 [Gossypium barbadense]|nr:hypothetical protein GOBAR_DD27383 [Gossypium barbadense]
MAGTGVFSDILDGDVYKYYADGEWKKSSSGKTVAIINPSTRKTQYKVQGTVNQQITAQKIMAKTPLWKRAELLPIKACLKNWFVAYNSIERCEVRRILISYTAEEGGESCVSDMILPFPPFNYQLTCGFNRLLFLPLHMVVHCTFNLRCFPKGSLLCDAGKGSEIGELPHHASGVNSFTGGEHRIAISKEEKDACIVLEDSDLDLVCNGCQVVLVMEYLFADVMVEKVKAKGGDDCDITPVVSESSANFIEGLVKDAKEKGATFCQEYKRDGNLIWPLLLDNVRPDMRIAWEEPFGPVLPVIRINSIEEGIHHCNASNFGLQGCVFTKDVNKAILISDAMETGTVQINSAPARGPDHFPFQGLKDSGIGSQGVTNSINMMTKIKSTVINLPTPSYTMG